MMSFRLRVTFSLVAGTMRKGEHTYTHTYLTHMCKQCLRSTTHRWFLLRLDECMNEQ